MFVRKIFVTLAGVWVLVAASTAFKLNSLGMFERFSKLDCTLWNLVTANFVHNT